MKNVSDAKLLPISAIQVPEKYRRSSSAVENDKLRQSIEQTGIQQPIVVSSLGNGKYVLIDGCRRLEVARYLKHGDVPCVIDVVPQSASPDDYRDRMRFILDEHRQDLFPTQRAMLIKTLKKSFDMNNREVGKYLGVDATTVSNWLMVDSYIPEVRQAIDSEEITQHAARVFEGMTPPGQHRIWKSHRKEVRLSSPSKLHRILREKYHPKTYPELYLRPEKVLRQLERVHGRRSSKRRPVITKVDREMLSSDIELRELELRDAERDFERFKLEIVLSARTIRAILQSEKLRSLVPKNKIQEFERFAEIY